MLTALLVLASPAAAVHQDDCAGGFDASSSASSAHGSMPQRITCDGAMDTSDSHDWYYVDVRLPSTADSITVTICPTGTLDADVRLHWLDLGGLRDFSTSLATAPGTQRDSSSASGQTCDTVSASVSLTEPGILGRWYIDVDHFSGAGGYEMRIT